VSRAEGKIDHWKNPITTAAFARLQTWPKQILWLMYTALEIELAPHKTAMSTSVHVMSPALFSFVWPRYAGTIARYAATNGVMSELSRRKVSGMGAGALWNSCHHSTTMSVVSVSRDLGEAHSATIYHGL
jgi:hypothetical protein